MKKEVVLGKGPLSVLGSWAITLFVKINATKTNTNAARLCLVMIYIKIVSSLKTEITYLEMPN